MNRGYFLINLVDFCLQPFTYDFKKVLDKNLKFQKINFLYKENKFVGIRFWDAPFIEIEKMVPKKGVITDLGCGEGIFTNYLGIESAKRKITGIEIDKDRFNNAQVRLKNVSFQNDDATKVKLHKSDCIILFHLLHHLKSRSDQEKVVKKCLSNLAKGGKLIIVEVDIKFNFKYAVSFFTDCFLVPWIFEKRFYTPVIYRTSKEWEKLIKSYGYQSKTIYLDKDKPFTHIAYEVKNEN